MKSEDVEIDMNDYDVVEISETDSIAVPKNPNIPEYGSVPWNDYVMKQFEPYELIDGNPNCAALRRVAELLLGEIIDSGPIREHAATDVNGPGRATVVFSVTFDWYNSGKYKTFREVADCWHGNTDDLFCAHPISTASTRAEGRALRKALKVRCLAAEELATKKDVAAIVRQSISVPKAVTGEISTNDKISDQQLNFLDSRCKAMNINALAYIEFILSNRNIFPNLKQREYKDVTYIQKFVACKVLEELVKYQNNAIPIPDEIRGYSSNWRNVLIQIGEKDK